MINLRNLDYEVQWNYKNEGRWMQLSAVAVNRGNEITLLL